MARKHRLLCAALLLVPQVILADWREDVAKFFGKTPDYRAAVEYLTAEFGRIDELERRTACGLLSYAYERLGDKAGAYKWLGDYFEAYGFSTAYFQFLESGANAAVSGYLRRWQLRYPLAQEIALIEARYPEGIPMPATQIVVVDMANEAFFKFSDESGPLRGGLFRRGFNTLSLGMSDLFGSSGPRIYSLELKADDLIVKKEIEVTARIDSRTIIKARDEEARRQEYTLSLFINDQLAAVSKKSLPYTPPWSFPLGQPLGRFMPFGPVDPRDRNNPALNSVPIMAIPMAITELLNALKKGKPPETAPIEKKAVVSFTFRERNLEGGIEEIKASILIKSKTARIYTIQ